MRHKVACWMQWKEQWDPRALGQFMGQRLFSISTVKAQTAAFLGSQDTGWRWTMALTLSDVYMYLLGAILSVTLEASFQPVKVDFWSIPNTFRSAISQKRKGWIHIWWLADTQQAWSWCKCSFIAWHRGVVRYVLPGPTGRDPPARWPRHTTTRGPRCCTWMCDPQV